MSVGKVAGTVSDLFYKSGALHYFAVASAVGAGTAGINAGMTLLNGANSVDPNTFENTGYAAGAALGAGAQLGLDVGFLRHSYLREGGTAGYIPKGANTTQGFRSMESLKESGEELGKGWTKGVKHAEGSGKFNLWSRMRGRPGDFSKAFSVGRGLTAFAAPIGIGIAAGAALGFAGKFMDEAWAEHRKSKMPTYDSRFFDTSKYDQSTYQQVGAGMQAYGSKMMSLSRIYHSR